LLSLLLTVRVFAAPDSEALNFFEAKIRPVLVESCYECHSAGKKQKGGLVLDTKAGWEKGGDTGPALTPGDVEKSLLVKAIRHTDPDLAMPPKKKLTDAQIADLEAWVKMGAPDPRTAAAAPTAFELIQQKGKTHWSYQPLPPLPKVEGHPIDTLLAQAGGKLAPLADARTLARRLSFDLLGLPPTAEDVEKFGAAAQADGAGHYVREGGRSPGGGVPSSPAPASGSAGASGRGPSGAGFGTGRPSEPPLVFGPRNGSSTSIVSGKTTVVFWLEPISSSVCR